MDSSRRSLSFRELEEQAEENPLRDMFASSSKRVINFADLEYLESQPSPTWFFLSISSTEVYDDFFMFHLKVVTRISIKESISWIQENSDSVQTIFLIDTKKIQNEAKQLGTKYIHLGCTRIRINPLVHRGLNTYVLSTVRDLTHNKYSDSLIGRMVTPLSNALVYFDCYQNVFVYTFDEHIKYILQL